jgi:hypothetical protein
MPGRRRPRKLTTPLSYQHSPRRRIFQLFILLTLLQAYRAHALLTTLQACICAPGQQRQAKGLGVPTRVHGQSVGYPDNNNAAR